MHIFWTRAFKQCFKKLGKQRQERIVQSIKKMLDAIEQNDLPAGVGLKQLRLGLWEIRAGLFDRIIFRRKDDTLELLIVGTHDEIVRFLKHCK